MSKSNDGYCKIQKMSIYIYPHKLCMTSFSLTFDKSHNVKHFEVLLKQRKMFTTKKSSYPVTLSYYFPYIQVINITASYS